ncbi:MAG: hypothetical protein JWM95_2419 [Gemmatimonadetes bacterium]|nr:hypothetical protein [Gemmatimonadota bacterium]
MPSPPVTNLLDRLDALRPSGRGWRARCPVCGEDGTLTLREGADGRAEFRCARGCDIPSIVRAVDLRLSDVIPESCRSSSTPARAPKDSERIVRLAEEAGDVFWHTSDGRAHVTRIVDGRSEHHAIDDGYSHRLAKRFRDHNDRPPGTAALREAMAVLRGIASDRPEYSVHIRTAANGGAMSYDLGDATHEQVTVTGDGWTVGVSDAVRFRRPLGMLALPRPVRGGRIAELRPFLNVATDDDFALVVGFLVAAMRPSGPYWLLAIEGGQGSGKSTMARVLGDLVDPALGQLVALPRKDSDLFVMADTQHVLNFNNCSAVPNWVSDLICTLCTGGGYRVRQLYTDRAPLVIAAQRPVIMNGIVRLATRPDLAERAIMVQCPRIGSGTQRTEREFDAEWERVRPRILGALFDALSVALARLDTLPRVPLPRMADAVEWVEAAAPALGWEPGYFLRIYNAMRAKSTADAAESDSLVMRLRVLLTAEPDGTLRVTLGELLTKLRGTEALPPHEWPRNAHALSGYLRRVQDRLEALGMTMTAESTRSNRGQLYRFALVESAAADTDECPPW